MQIISLMKTLVVPRLLESTIIDQLTFQLIWSFQVADTDLFTAVT